MERSKLSQPSKDARALIHLDGKWKKFEKSHSEYDQIGTAFAH